jgi:hypothetical protein
MYLDLGGIKRISNESFKEKKARLFKLNIFLKIILIPTSTIKTFSCNDINSDLYKKSVVEIKEWRKQVLSGHLWLSVRRDRHVICMNGRNRRSSPPTYFVG